MTILKINPNRKIPVPMLFIFNGSHCAAQEVGPVKREYYEMLIKQKKLPEIDTVKIIEKYYKHAEMMRDVKDCNYYELKLIEK